jgi:hypothetical protein
MDQERFNETYERLNKAWKDTCNIIFGEEIGELKEYEDWLKQGMDPIYEKKSAFSGKPVFVAIPYYCENSKFIALKEIEQLKNPAPLNINEIKDIDSIIQALQERFYYSGDIILANSQNVSKSSNIFNSFYVLNSNFIFDSENVAYSSNVRWGKYIFGTNNTIECSFGIRDLESYKNARCFETWDCYFNSDCYFSFGIEWSQNVLFSFNVKNKRNVIGNLELEKGKYLLLKEKILNEIKDELISKKKFPALTELISKNKKPKVSINIEETQDEQNFEPIEKGFRQTTKIVLRKELTDINKYEKWLMQYVHPIETLKSAVSDKIVYYGYSGMKWALPRDKIVKDKESRKLGEILKLEKEDIESLESIKNNLWKIAFFRTEARVGNNKNLIKVPLANSSLNCYNGGMYAFSQNCAFCFWPRNSEYIFGSNTTFSSNFCINTYYSFKLSRCFEVDCSSNCSDLYFSHNCENVHESFFCFNSKNLSHAIGNYQFQKEKYKDLKNSLLEQISSELEKKKTLKWSIYNIGCFKI